MSKFRYLPLLALTLLLFAGVASAQDNKSSSKPQTLDLNGTTGELTVQRIISATANVNLTIGDQLYQLRVPVTINIDASTVLSDAKITVPTANQVGVLGINPISVEVLEGEYDKDYHKVSPSSDDNVIVVYTVELTNLHNETIKPGYSDAFETIAIDEAGQTYEEKEKVCDEIDPGETTTCEVIFDVPETAKLIDLEVKTFAVKRFSFTK